MISAVDEVQNLQSQLPAWSESQILLAVVAKTYSTIQSSVEDGDIVLGDQAIAVIREPIWKIAKDSQALSVTRRISTP